MKYKWSYIFSVGFITIIEEQGFIIGVVLNNNKELLDFVEFESDLIKSAKKEIEEFLLGERRNFTIPLKLKGTDFQKKVWQILSKIEYGKVKTYKEVSLLLGSKNHSRAVGMACGANPIIFLIPCHRVVGSVGLGGYGGGLELKEKLLKMERDNL